MKLSKLIRELSVARDMLKVDPEVEVYTHLGADYIGEVQFVSYTNKPDNIRIVCE